MAYISKITLPTGTTYDIKAVYDGANNVITDTYATKEEISGLSGAMHYAGITGDVLVDGSNENAIEIDGESVEATPGMVVISGEQEFVWNGSKWQEFGSTGSLKALAFKDSATTSYTPDGSVSQPTFSGTAGNLSVSGTPTGSVEVTATANASGNYTPTGTVSQPTTTVTLTSTTVNSITDVGSLPSCTLPTLETSVANETLSLTWTAGSFSAGSLPTKGSDTTVATGVESAVTSQPTFAGTAVQLGGSFSGDALTSTGTFTPAGTVSQPTFSGTSANITVS